jgi:hypothetical protein
MLNEKLKVGLKLVPRSFIQESKITIQQLPSPVTTLMRVKCPFWHPQARKSL